MTKVIFRCDAGTAPEIGTGHIVRCLTLADAIVEKGIVRKRDILFLTRNDPGFDAGEGVLKRRDFSYESVSNQGLEANSEKEKAYLSSCDASFVVMDRLETSAELIKSIHSNDTKVVTFDDYGSGRTEADVAICAIFDDVEPSSNLHQGYAYLILSGNSYEPKEISQNSHRLCATFGGNDARDLCSHFLGCIDAVPESAEVDIILGKAEDLALEGYNEQIKSKGWEDRVRIHVRPSNYHEILASADIAVSAGGLSIFEFAAWGVPTIGLPQYPHQLRTIEKLAACGVVNLGSTNMELDNNRLRSEIEKMFKDNSQRKIMAQAARNLIDGQGLSRVVNIISQLAATRADLPAEVKA